MQSPIQLVRKNPVVAVVITLSGIFLAILSWSTAIEDTLGIGPKAKWLLTTEWGRGLMMLVGIGMIVAFWVVYPLCSTFARRTVLGKLCNRLEALASPIGVDPTDHLLSATAAGAIVVKMRNRGAFRDDVLLEEVIDTAMRGQMPVQTMTPGQGPKDKGEYQAFWRTRHRVMERMGLGGHCAITQDNVTAGCRCIAANVRQQWSIKQPIPDIPGSPKSEVPAGHP